MICIKCQQNKPDVNFAYKNKAKQVRHHICKECQLIYSRKYYRNNRQLCITRSQNNKQKAAQWLLEYKSTLVCSRCGMSHPACLDFHHQDSDDKLYNIADMIGRSGINKLKAEINKCIILCANCHRILHYEQQTTSIG